MYTDEVGIRFEWYMLRIDQYDSTMSVKIAGEGTSLELIIPAEQQYYNLSVKVVMDKKVKMVTAKMRRSNSV